MTNDRPRLRSFVRCGSLAENEARIFRARRAADGAVCVSEGTYRAKAVRAISERDHPRGGREKPRSQQ